MLPKWVEVTKNWFNEIRSIVSEAKNNELETKIGNKMLRINNSEKFLKEIASWDFNRNEATKMHKNVMSEANITSGLNKTNNRIKMWEISGQLR